MWTERMREVDNVSEEEVLKALNKMNLGKSTGLGWTTFKLLRKGSEFMVKWLKRMVDTFLNNGKAPEYWRVSCLRSINKGRGHRSERISYRKIGLFSIPRRVYRWIIICKKVTCSGC